MKILIFIGLWMLFSLIFMLVYDLKKEADILEKTIVVIICFPWAIIGRIKIWINNIREGNRNER